ncbi:AraC family transcriptional regulator [Kibdelosporangium aridum]|uniref:AraC family transcriptional regulator n=1 Tax=Kibdelosporangium aridum TaxID=2030 RepID=UPI000A03DE9E|nr:helix-turn-helix transcriptional regulator [Kibdelosporangium aridum]
MSRTGHGIWVGSHSLLPGTRFDWHEHDAHQLNWAEDGALTIGTATGTWVLPPTRALWIPAGVRHTTGSSRSTKMRSLLIHSDLVPWTVPTVIRVGPLLGPLLSYLCSSLAAGPRSRAEALLQDLLDPVPTAPIELPMPQSDRTLRIAAALRIDPADGRTLAEWGRVVGASSRTLARLFGAETGLGFAEWRTRLRLTHALGLLAGGTSVAATAHLVGYSTPSAFVSAFRRTTGTSPARYFTAE